MPITPSPRRILFFGTPAFAVPTLEQLVARGHTIVGVVTQPDKPRGRGQKLSEMPVKALALAHGLPVLQPARLSREVAAEMIIGAHADLGVVAAYGKILPDWLLAVPPLGLINVHASLLPRYRGAAPIHRAVMAGDEETGVTIMRVVKALDAGATIATVRTPIGRDETSVEVEQRLAALGGELLVDTIDAMQAGEAVETPQDDAQATYASRIVREDGVIDWSRSSREVHDQVRGLHPWPHAFTALEGARVILHRTRVGHRSTDAAPGTIVQADREALVVAAAAGTTLQILELQAEGRRMMDSRAFLAGHALTAGQRFV